MRSTKCQWYCGLYEFHLKAAGTIDRTTTANWLCTRRCTQLKAEGIKMSVCLTQLTIELADHSELPVCMIVDVAKGQFGTSMIDIELSEVTMYLSHR